MAPIDRPAARKMPIWSLSSSERREYGPMATLLKILNNLADIKSAGVLHFASELSGGLQMLRNDSKIPRIGYGGQRNEHAERSS
jgi:hypothetical protein